MGEGFCRPARQKIAGILAVFQDFLTRQGGKRPGQTAFIVCEYRFSDLSAIFFTEAGKTIPGRKILLLRRRRADVTKTSRFVHR